MGRDTFETHRHSELLLNIRHMILAVIGGWQLWNVNGTNFQGFGIFRTRDRLTGLPTWQRIMPIFENVLEVLRSMIYEYHSLAIIQTAST